jgi:hypothetical protein
VAGFGDRPSQDIRARLRHALDQLPLLQLLDGGERRRQRISGVSGKPKLSLGKIECGAEQVALEQCDRLGGHLLHSRMAKL